MALRVPIIVTKKAWKKMFNIASKNINHNFLFSANGGGCNGFNYKLELIKNNDIKELLNNKIKPSIIENNNVKLIIEPTSELLLLGTTIDYIKEDYSKNIFESKFIFTPKKDFATTCGCGVSFSLK